MRTSTKSESCCRTSIIILLLNGGAGIYPSCSVHQDSGKRHMGATERLWGGTVFHSGPLMGLSPQAWGSCGVCVSYSRAGILAPMWPGWPFPHHVQPARLEDHCSKFVEMKGGKKRGCPLRHVEWLSLPFFSPPNQRLVSLLLIIPYRRPSIFSSQWAANMALWEISTGLPMTLSLSPSSSSLVSDTISHPFLLETAGWFSATPCSHASSPCLATSSALAGSDGWSFSQDPMPSPQLFCPLVTIPANPKLQLSCACR